MNIIEKLAIAMLGITEGIWVARDQTQNLSASKFKPKWERLEMRIKSSWQYYSISERFTSQVGGL